MGTTLFIIGLALMFGAAVNDWIIIRLDKANRTNPQMDGPIGGYDLDDRATMAHNLGQQILIKDKKGKLVPLVKKNSTEPKSAYRKEMEKNMQKWMFAHHLAANEVMFSTSAPVRRSKHTWEA